MAQSLFVLGTGRLLVRRPPLPPQTIALPALAWRETAAALRLDADGLTALLLPLRDGRFGLALELAAVGEPRCEVVLPLPEAWVLVDGPAQRWVRRRAREAAVILGDEADERRRRVRELAAELAFVDVLTARLPGLGRAA